MSRTSWRERDEAIRKHYQKLEREMILYKALVINKKLSKYKRRTLKTNFNMSFVNLLYTREKVKNRCVVTGRAASVSRFFRLTRQQVLTAMNKRYLTGVRKSTW